MERRWQHHLRVHRPWHVLVTVLRCPSHVRGSASRFRTHPLPHNACVRFRPFRFVALAPNRYTDPSYFASSLCTDGVAALQHRAEVSWGSPVAVGNEEREAGTIGFVSFDTATNVRGPCELRRRSIAPVRREPHALLAVPQIMQLQHGVCLKVFPDGSNNLVFYILDGAPPSGDDEWDACDNANWPASINGPTAQATCDVSSGVKYVDRYPTTSTVCPSPGTCDSDIDCVAPSPCAVAMCDTGSNTCTVTNHPDGSFCSETGLCLSGECFDYTGTYAQCRRRVANLSPC